MVLLLLVLTDLMLGSYAVSIKNVWNGIFNFHAENPAEMTVRVFRFPRVMMAVFAGAALSVAGLLMQTLFQNPLAGPYVLGINSGASLMVAAVTMAGFSIIGGSGGIVLAAMIGAFAAGIFILFASLFVKNKVSLLLVGIMFGSFTGSIVSVLQAYADPNNLKAFMLWSFGSLNNVEFHQLIWVVFPVLLALFLSLFLVKPLNLLVLGENNAKVLGVNVKFVRVLIVLITAVLTGVVTAFAGPIAFVGLVVPNLVKLLYKSANHLHLLVGSILLGANLIVVCDVLMQLLLPVVSIPLNALTALIGAPVVIWIIMRKF